MVEHFLIWNLKRPSMKIKTSTGYKIISDKELAKLTPERRRALIENKREGVNAFIKNLVLRDWK